MINKDKEYKTRGGKPVRIANITRYQVHGSYQATDKDGTKQWISFKWGLNGRAVHSKCDHHLDLMKV